MSAIFYDHLIDWQAISNALEAKGLEKGKKLIFIEQIEEEVHTEVLGVVMDHLPREKHEEFLVRFHAAPHDPEHLHYLVKYSPLDVEGAIKDRAREVVEGLLVEIGKL